MQIKSYKKEIKPLWLYLSILNLYMSYYRIVPFYMRIPIIYIDKIVSFYYGIIATYDKINVNKVDIPNENTTLLLENGLGV